MLDQSKVFPRQPTDLLRDDRLFELLVVVVFDKAPDGVLVISQNERQKLVLSFSLKDLVWDRRLRDKRPFSLGPLRSLAQIRLGFRCNLLLL